MLGRISACGESANWTVGRKMVRPDRSRDGTAGWNRIRGRFSPIELTGSADDDGSDVEGNDVEGNENEFDVGSLWGSATKACDRPSRKGSSANSPDATVGWDREGDVFASIGGGTGLITIGRCPWRESAGIDSINSGSTGGIRHGLRESGEATEPGATPVPIAADVSVAVEFNPVVCADATETAKTSTISAQVKRNPGDLSELTCQRYATDSISR
ncbi:hypothetical protein NHH03_01580 [Stieleria sp. TO1_6]|uniref:hypothetical protein n=1 Tax=Stieleria tagensis TaxID=2956795 RepID=UPI00209B037E|nr:hypothetical protein [Stieleria tagensis]MCO8120410.1 hypothetical protein [Stieleria tagensis]